MRVLHYVKSFSKLSQTFIYDLIKELETQGVENYIITKNRLNIKERPFDKVIIIKEPPKWHPQCMLEAAMLLLKQGHYYDFRWKIFRERILREIKKINPDIIHSHFGPAGIIMAPIAQKLNIPHVISFHGFDAFKITQDQFWLKKYQSLEPDNQTILCVSEYMKNHLSNIFPSHKIDIIHVGKKLDDYQFNLPQNIIRNWLSIGRLTDKKGHIDTLRAFASIAKKHPKQKLKIIGEGELHQSLEKAIKTLNLQSNVILLGAIPHTKTKKELEKADAFILASKTADDGDKEGIPTVLMEAQAIGLPCISTLHSGIPEVFTKRQNSFLAEEGNILELQNKMEALINLPLEKLQKMSKENRQYIQENFNLETETSKLISIYNRIFEQ